jgi:hypothetical protein
MSQFQVRIDAVTTNGPYAYRIYKGGAGQKDVNNVANIGAALDGVKADIAGLLNGETVTTVSMTVQSA